MRIGRGNGVAHEAMNETRAPCTGFDPGAVESATDEVFARSRCWLRAAAAFRQGRHETRWRAAQGSGRRATARLHF